MAASVVMAVAEVSGEHQGETVTVAEGQRVAGNHPLVARYPGVFYPADDPAEDLAAIRERYDVPAKVEAEPTCRVCGRTFGNAGALASHEASHEADVEVDVE
jgi:hypothetical protein